MTLYAPGSQIQSADLNDWQTRMFGERSAYLIADDFLNLAGFTKPAAEGAVGATATAASGAAVMRGRLPLIAGDRLLSYSATWDDGAGTSLLACYVMNYHPGLGDSLGTITSSGAGALETQTLALVTPRIVTEGEALYAVVKTSGAGTAVRTFYAFEITYDHPAP